VKIWIECTLAERFMAEVSQLLNHWGYAAIFGLILLGNLGFPFPEEVVLLLGGYLVWEGKFQLVPVIVVGIVSGVIGDSLGYCFGRHYGQAAIRRYGHRLLITSARLAKAKRFVARYGSFAVFVARFLPGLRFMAGPLAGSMGLPFSRFFIANLLGGLVYVPLPVAGGYLLGKGFGSTVKRIERFAGKAEHYGIFILAFATVVILVWRALSSRKASQDCSES
jgi:membrane protein DedA with SNARE-associated domain